MALYYYISAWKAVRFNGRARVNDVLCMPSKDILSGFKRTMHKKALYTGFSGFRFLMEPFIKKSERWVHNAVESSLNTGFRVGSRMRRVQQVGSYLFRILNELS